MQRAGELFDDWCIALYTWPVRIYRARRHTGRHTAEYFRWINILGAA